jgi:hypothetical protein|mmetsp:Transcript_113971/g.179921  ORF Transcript_113971/g.179921 Transcript_113971/m.179921 type:complete len:146 (-) Transcript_113971:1012-1449(-)
MTDTVSSADSSFTTTVNLPGILFNLKELSVVMAVVAVVVVTLVLVVEVMFAVVYVTEVFVVVVEARANFEAFAVEEELLAGVIKVGEIAADILAVVDVLDVVAGELLDVVALPAVALLVVAVVLVVVDVFVVDVSVVEVVVVTKG